MSKCQNPKDQELSLLIDTSLEEARVVLRKGDKVIGEKKWKSGASVGRELLGVISKLLEKNSVELDEIRKIEVNTESERRSCAVRAGVTVANMLSLVTRGTPPAGGVDNSS